VLRAEKRYTVATSLIPAAIPLDDQKQKKKKYIFIQKK